MPESLQSKLAAARKRWQSLLATRGAALGFALMAALALVSYHSDRFFVLSSSGRLAWLITLIAALAGSALLLILLPARRPISDEAVASVVERRFPTLGERLLTTIELAHAGAAAGVSTQMVATVAREAESLAMPLDFRQAVPGRIVQRPAMLACAAGLLLVTHMAVLPGAMLAWLNRILHPSADIPIYARTQVYTGPGDIVAPRGEDVALQVRVTGRLTDQAALLYRFDGGSWARVDLRKPQPGKEDAQKFAFRLADVQQSFTYYATSGDGRSNPHTVRIEDRPTILSVRLKLDYPPYTHKKSEEIVASSGNIVAPIGTHAEVIATANKSLRNAELRENGADAGPWTVEGDKAKGELRIAHDETYGLKLHDRNGFEGLNPAQYTVRAQPDRAPEVQILKPGGDIDRTPTAVVGLKVAANDDYGVEDLHLAWSAGKRQGGRALPGANGARQAVAAGSWSLAELNLKPGDTVTYEALARDGDNVSGPHTTKSASYRIHILGVAEMRERLEAQMAQEREMLRQLVQRQRDSQTALAQAQRTERPQEMGQAQSAQRSVAQDARDLANRMQQTSEQLRDNQLGSQQQQQQRQEMENTLQKLGSQAMPHAADTIQRAEQQPASRQNQLASAAQQEQQIRDQLEQMAQQQQTPQDPYKLAAEADRLAQDQQRLAEQSDLAAAQTENRPANQLSPEERARMSDLARQQQALNERTRELQKQVQRAAQDARDRGSRNSREMQQAAKQMQQSGVQQKQSSAQQNLQQGSPQQASPQQNQAAQDLRDLANQLDQAVMKSDTNNLDERAKKLDAAADKLMELVTQQNRLRSQTQGATQDQARQLSPKQQGLQQQTNNVAPELRDAPRAQQAVQRAMQNMQQAAGQMSDGKPQEAVSPQAQAAAELLRAVREARDTAQAMQEQQSARDMQQKVARLARDQRTEMNQTRQFDQQRQNAQLSQPQQQRAQQLAQGQQKLLERSRDLSEDMPSRPFSWAVGEASRRMERATNALNSQNTGGETQRHQENAAQTLERIARSLDQQAQGQQQEQNSPGESGAQQNVNEGSGELQLAREMQAQIRQETGSLERRRQRNPNRQLTEEQRRELNNLTESQREARQIANSLAQRMRSTPEIGQPIERAANQMEEIQDQLRQQQTGQPTQGKQDEAVQNLDRAIRAARQAMREQRQQMAQQGQQGQQPGQQPGQQQANGLGGNAPRKSSFAPQAGVENGKQNQANQRGRGFGALSPRAQQQLKEGQQERVPVEFQEMVNQYFKALSERGGGSR